MSFDVMLNKYLKVLRESLGLKDSQGIDVIAKTIAGGTNVSFYYEGITVDLKSSRGGGTSVSNKGYFTIEIRLNVNQDLSDITKDTLLTLISTIDYIDATFVNEPNTYLDLETYYNTRRAGLLSMYPKEIEDYCST